MVGIKITNIKMGEYTVSTNEYKRLRGLAMQLDNITKVLSKNEKQAIEMTVAAKKGNTLESEKMLREAVLHKGRRTLEEIAQLSDQKIIDFRDVTSIVVTDMRVRDIEWVKDLKNLKSAAFPWLQIFDFSALKGLKDQLEYVDLKNTWATDVSFLKGAKKLKYLNIKGTLVPKVKVEELRKSLPPDCRIVY